MKEVNMKQLNKKQINWYRALASGKYKPIEGSLKNEDGFCCLGGAAPIAVIKNIRNPSWRIPKRERKERFGIDL
jgi:hypothetical protein